MATSFQPIPRKCRNGDRLRKSGKWGDEIHHYVIKNNRKMDASVLDAIPAGFRKVLGVAKLPSGLWGVTMLNPITEIYERLGIYDTPENAADAYLNKKLEFESVLHGRELGKKKTGVWYSPSTGKWGAAIRNPVSKVLEWVGTYDTIEEAKAAFNKEKQVGAEKVDLSASDYGKSVFRKPEGILFTESGRWRARIYHPVTKALLYLGTYDTPKEAEDAHKAKELEFERMFPSHKKRRPRARPQWYAVVEDPVPRCSNYFYLGMFGSADEAEEALRRKKMELDSMASAGANGAHVDMENDCEQKPIPVQENEVVNAYGELVGEYSRIDEELWLV